MCKVTYVTRSLVYVLVSYLCCVDVVFIAGARARLASLPDAERRAAAAHLAMKLSMMMGAEDGSDSDSEAGDVTAADDRQQQATH